MLTLAESGGIDIILTKSISRFARNTVDLLEIVRKLKSLNVEVRFEEERINTLDGDGELMLTVLSSFAQEESKSVSDNIKWMFHKKFESGELLINATRFLGYDKNEFGELIINQAEAKIVKLIFTEYLAGNGAVKIAKLLNSENIPTVTGAKWSTTTILDILKNEKYKGDVKLQKTYVKDHLSKKKCRNHGEVDSFYVEENHSPIVTREMWEQVQLLMISRAKAKGNIIGDREKYRNRYPLTGMLFCGICGAPLIRRTWSNKKIFWQCSNYIRNGKQACKGTKIEDNVICDVNIQQPTIVRGRRLRFSMGVGWRLGCWMGRRWKWKYKYHLLF